MIDYNNTFQEMTITCDNCHDEITEAGSFQECMDLFKQYGWRTYKDEHGEWTHDCPDCVRGPSAREDFK